MAKIVPHPLSVNSAVGKALGGSISPANIPTLNGALSPAKKVKEAESIATVISGAIGNSSPGYAGVFFKDSVIPMPPS